MTYAHVQGKNPAHMNIKPVEHKTSGWCVVCPVGFEGETKRRFKYFQTKTAAQNFAKVVNNWRHARKAPRLGGEIAIREEHTGMVALLLSYGIQSAQELSEILSSHQRTNAVVKVSLRDAVEKFIKHVETEDKPRAAYLLDIVGKLNRFSTEFPGSQAHEFDRAEIKEYLLDWENPATRNQHLKRLSKFYDWARKERHVAIDPTVDIDFSKVEARENIEIYSVEQATKLIQTADTDYRSIAPWFALGLFGFMRSSEIQKLDWSAIDFEKGSITVAAGIAKTGKRRVIELNDCLRYWLKPYHKLSGSVVGHLNGEVGQCFTAAGVKRLHNGLRHSCVSYAAKGTDIGLDGIFLQAGHTPSVSLKHYLEGMTKAEALPYWSIRRQADTP
jgi:integrase